MHFNGAGIAFELNRGPIVCWMYMYIFCGYVSRGFYYLSLYTFATRHVGNSKQEFTRMIRGAQRCTVDGLKATDADPNWRARRR
jgi:hypothetical protein